MDLRFALLSFVLFVGYYVVQCAEPELIVQLKAGKVQGRVEPVGSTGKVHVYEGIRYGHANRFENPKPVEPWTGVLNATKFGPSCPQFPGDSAHPGSEDCLYLNVWQPATETHNRSVMVWIHGGSYVTGSGGSNARHLVHDGDVVVVGINYRLGPLGFLYAGVAGHEGNYGIHDQILALQWVRDNIAHFGGDPNQVTIFGQSAGSWSVSTLILSPLAKGLFKRAIMQSGATQTASQNKTEALKVAHSFGAHLECAQQDGAGLVACLKGKPLADLHKPTYVPRQTTYETDLLPLKPSEALLTGKFNHVDLLSGVCNNEGAGYVGTMVKPDSTTKSVHDAIAHHFAAPEVADFYTAKLPATPTEEDYHAIVARAMGDERFDCPTVLFTEQFGKFASASQNIYNYRLMQSVAHNNISSWSAVPHGSDGGFIFPAESTASTSLSKDMIRAWTAFAKTGHPTPMGTVTWAPAITDHTHPVVQYMQLHANDYKMVAGAYVQVCDALWKPRQLHA